VYLETHCNIGSKRAFTNWVLDSSTPLVNALFEPILQCETRQVTQLFTYLLTHKPFSSCIWRYLISQACVWVMPALSAVLLTFSVQCLLFFHAGSQAAAAAYLVYPISDTERCRKCGKYVPCTQRTSQQNNFELILTVKIETRHPVEGPFGSEFPAIYNHCGVMAALSRKTWKFSEQHLRFSGKTIPYGNFFKIPFRKFTWRHGSTLLCLNVVKFVRREIDEVVRYWPNHQKQKFGCLSNCRY